MICVHRTLAQETEIHDSLVYWRLPANEKVYSVTGDPFRTWYSNHVRKWGFSLDEISDFE